MVQLLNAGPSWHGKITVARWHDPSCFMLLVDSQTYSPVISSCNRCAWWHIQSPNWQYNTTSYHFYTRYTVCCLILVVIWSKNTHLFFWKFQTHIEMVVVPWLFTAKLGFVLPQKATYAPDLNLKIHWKRRWKKMCFGPKPWLVVVD